MNDSDMKRLQASLMQRQTDLQSIEKSAQEAAAVVELDQTRVGRLSRMDAMQQQAMAKATAARRHDELRRIRIALKRIELGEFGECDECGDEIALKRLEIDPSISLCIRCAS